MSENNQMSKDERRCAISSLRTGLNIVIVICVALAFFLVGIFVLDGVGGGIENTVTFWTQKVLSGVGSLMIMFACANITEETLKRKNKYYGARLEALDDHYSRVMNGGETAQVELFLTNKNRRNKYHAYLRRYKRLMQVARRLHLKKLVESFERKLLLTADEVWDLGFPRIRYHKLTFDKLISGASAVIPNDDTADVDIHRMKYALQKTLWKAVCIIGFGCYVSDLVYHFTTFTNAMIVPLIFKIVVVLWAVYSGVCFGYTMMDRILIVLKRKLVVFSEFRTRTDVESNEPDSARYAVSIECDRIVEKLKAKYGAEQDSATESYKFKPVSPSGIVKRIAVNQIKKHIDNTQVDVTNDVTKCG